MVVVHTCYGCGCVKSILAEMSDCDTSHISRVLQTFLELESPVFCDLIRANALVFRYERMWGYTGGAAAAVQVRNRCLSLPSSLVVCVCQPTLTARATCADGMLAILRSLAC